MGILGMLNKRKKENDSDLAIISFNEQFIRFKKNEIGEVKRIDNKRDKNRGNIDDNKNANDNISKTEENKNKKECYNEEEENEEFKEELKNKNKALIKNVKEIENLKKKVKELENNNKDLEKENKEREKKIKELSDENKHLKSLVKDNNENRNPINGNEIQNMSQANNNKGDNNLIINEKNQKFLEKELIKKQVFQSIQDYKQPTLVGLQNIGATCFMNSTLQCLSQTKRLTNYFLKEKSESKIIKNNIAISNPKEHQLSPVYLELIQNLWNNGGKKYYAPYKFMNTINDMNPLFKRGEAGDAKDFIIFVLEQMHKELSRSLNSKKKLNILKEVPKLNQYDKNNCFNNFFNCFTEDTSIISDLFYGFNETTNICLNCKKRCQGVNYPICYNYGIFNVIIFPLEEVKNMKNKNNMNNLYKFYQGPSNIVNIDDCFIYNQKTEVLTGENKNYCNLCKQLCDSLYTSKIYTSPIILILILNRGKGNIYKVKMDFQNTIDITNYVIEKDNPRIIYNLYGVITHLGESGPNAHFVATCKSPVDGKWYRYNDAFVTPISDFNKDVYNFGVPYILFYEKIN